MIFTDYTDQSTFALGYSQQYRILKYFKDLLKNWFADSRNILDDRLLGLMYSNSGNLNPDCVKIGTIYNQDGIYAGTTPAIIISLGDIDFTGQHINSASNPAFSKNPTVPMISDFKFKSIPIGIHVITQSCDGTILLAELISNFVLVNTQAILKDQGILSQLRLARVSAPRQLKPGQQGNAKRVYQSTIQIQTTSIVVWDHDTQGPVFRGLSIATNLNKE